MSSGIYKWTNKETKNVYIGQSNNLEKRMRDFLDFKRPYAGNKINEERKKYPSLKYWVYDILDECEKNQLNILEREYIKKYEKEGDILNTYIPSIDNSDIDEKKQNFNIAFRHKLYSQINYIFERNKTRGDILLYFMYLVCDKRVNIEDCEGEFLDDRAILNNRVLVKIPFDVYLEHNIMPQILISNNDLLWMGLLGWIALLQRFKEFTFRLKKEEFQFSYYFTNIPFYKDGFLEFELNKCFLEISKQIIEEKKIFYPKDYITNYLTPKT